MNIDIAQLLLVLGLILILVKIFGEFFERIEMPSIFGDILVGIILGPLLGIIVISIATENSQLSTGYLIKILADIGAIFLLFSIGFDKIDTGKILEYMKRAFPITILGALFPFMGGFLVSYIFSAQIFPPGDALRGSLLIGTALAATSIGVGARTLMDMKYITTAAGSAVIITAVVDNFISLGFFTAIYSIIEQSKLSYSEVATSIIMITIFCIIIYLSGKYLFTALAEILDKMMVEEAIFGVIIGVLFIFAYLSNVFGLHMIIGAFIFGAAIARVPRIKSDAVVHRVRGISHGFFIPFFFVYIGLLFDFGAIATAGTYAIALLFALIVFQITGGFLGGKISKFSNRDALIIGTACIPRNELALIIATTGLTLGLYGSDVFSAFVLLSIATTIITPLMLRLLISKSVA